MTSRRGVHTSALMTVLAVVLVMMPPRVASAAQLSSSPSSTRPDDGFVEVKVDHHLDPSSQDDEYSVHVWLPPDYPIGSRSYRTLYLLHSSRPDSISQPEWMQNYGRPQLGRALDAMHARGQLSNIIVVRVELPDEDKTYPWRNLPVNNLVSAIDREFQTLPDPSARGISGHSMGGHCALNIAIRNPQIFGAVYAMSPCCMLEDSDSANPVFPDSLSLNLMRLKGIAFDAGREDQDRNIPLSIALLDSLLVERRIPHVAELYTGDHYNRIPERLLTHVIPFMKDILSPENEYDKNR